MPDVSTQTDPTTRADLELRTQFTQTWHTAAGAEQRRERIRTRAPTPAARASLSAAERVVEHRSTSPIRPPPGLLCGACGALRLFC